MILPSGAATKSWFAWKAPKPGESYSMLVKVHGEASDPLVSMAANIDYYANFVVNVDTARSRLLVGVFGVVDSFPAFEAYVTYRGVTKVLFQLPPPAGNTVVNLVGSAGKFVAAAQSFP
jgi:hypothetical protein